VLEDISLQATKKNSSVNGKVEPRSQASLSLTERVGEWERTERDIDACQVLTR